MTGEEAARILALLAAAYPDMPLPAETVQVYTAYLLPLEVRVVERAVVRLIAERRSPPRIADLLAACGAREAVVTSLLPPAEEGEPCVPPPPVPHQVEERLRQDILGASTVDALDGVVADRLARARDRLPEGDWHRLLLLWWQRRETVSRQTTTTRGGKSGDGIC